MFVTHAEVRVDAQLEKRQLTERVRAGMERARAEGKSLGRPRRRRPVTDHPSWSRVVRAIEAGDLTRAEAAKELHVRKATLIEALGSFPKGGASAVARTDFDQGS